MPFTELVESTLESAGDTAESFLHDENVAAANNAVESIILTKGPLIFFTSITAFFRASSTLGFERKFHKKLITAKKN
jgi:hypothetical protein